MHDYLIAAIVIEALVVLAFALAWRRARRARRSADACDFPGCIEARRQLRELAAKDTTVPSGDVIAFVEGVEATEHRDHK